MANPFIKSPLGGILGVRNASFFRLDPLTATPIAPLGDLIAPFFPDKMSLDVVDSEDYELNYSITENPLQDFTSASSNVHKDLERVTVSGTLVSSIDLGILGSVGLPLLRSDLLKIANLERIADKREPILFVSPRVSMAKCFIASILRSWNPELGDNTNVTISLVEARIVNPLQADAVVPDVAGSFTGNNAASAVGTQAPSSIGFNLSTQPGAFGLPPTF